MSVANRVLDFLIVCPLIALTPAGGEVLARIVHNNRDRTFRLRVEVS